MQNLQIYIIYYNRNLFAVINGSLGLVVNRILTLSKGGGKARVDFVSYSSRGELGVQIYAADQSLDEWMITTSNNFPLGTWHHVAFTFDGASKTGKIYKNGMEKSQRLRNSV